jgi:hypothetical protein
MKVMRLDEFTSTLYDEMERKLTEISMRHSDFLQISRDSSASILQFISRLKMFLSDYKFTNHQEEIDFFKTIKPKFISKLIYHQKIFKIQSRLPVGTSKDIKNYYHKELKNISQYFNSNSDFFIYYRSNATSLDEVYFIRKEPDSWLLLNFEDYETDLNFTTIYDHKVSKIIAFELLSEFIKTSIDKLEIQSDTVGNKDPGNKQQINWTGSKVSLVELLYALQSTGSCNNGTIDLKQLANQLEHFFNIDLGNYYRVFQEMRIRKINRTTFLDQLKHHLIQRMDETDENPKFK